MRYLFAFLVITAAHPAFAAYRLIDLGGIDGKGSYGIAVSDNGIALANGSGGTQVWRNDGMGFRLLPSLTPGGTSRAYDVNELGQIVGESNGFPVMWDETGVHQLDTQPGRAQGINNDGVIIGTRNPGAWNQKVLRWKSPVETPQVVFPTERQTGIAINNRNLYVGEYWSQTLGDCGYSGSENPFPRPGTPANGFFSLPFTPTDIGDDNTITGYLDDNRGFTMAYVRNGVTGEIKRVPTPENNGYFSRANGANASGLIVGFDEALSGAFTYRFGDITATSLTSQLHADFSDWNIWDATGVNSRGWIVGTGSNLGPYSHAVLLIPISEDVLPGDFTNDGVVTADDLEVWKADFGAGTEGDANNDGYTDGRDFLAWQRNYAVPVPPTVVPEPSSIALLAIAATMLYRRKPA